MSSTLPISLSDGKTLNLQIKKSNSAKQLWLKSNIYGIYIVVPTTKHYEINDIVNFIDTKKKWLKRQSDYYERLKSKYNNQDIFKLDGQNDYNNTIFFLGTKYLFYFIKDKRTDIIISDNLKKITFHITDRRKYKDYIKKWYRTQTARIIADRLPLIITNKLNLLLPSSLIVPFHYNKISIKEQKSMWGSCSIKRNLNFNLFLAALPVKIIDYVIIHELVHLIELNHSKKFWNLIGLVDTEYKNHREWLHRYGSLVKIP